MIALFLVLALAVVVDPAQIDKTEKQPGEVIQSNAVNTNGWAKKVITITNTPLEWSAIGTAQIEVEEWCSRDGGNIYVREGKIVLNPAVSGKSPPAITITPPTGQPLQNMLCKLIVTNDPKKKATFGLELRDK